MSTWIQPSSTSASYNSLMTSTKTTTSGGSLSLYSYSAFNQILSGSSNHTIVLPSSSSIANGYTINIINNSTGTITINSFTAVLITSLARGYSAACTFVGTDDTVAAWSLGVTLLRFNNTAGVLSIANGGTGQYDNGTSGQILASLGGGNSNWITTLPVANGGTGVDIIGTSGQIATSNGTTLNYITTLPIANGGTAVTSVTTTPTASSWAGWDANSNMSSRNTKDGLDSRTAAGTLITPDATWSHYQNFRAPGSSANTIIKFPNPSTLGGPGVDYDIVNESGYVLTVQASDASVIQVMANLTTLNMTAVSNGVTSTSWSWKYGLAQQTTGTVTSVSSSSTPSAFTLSTATGTTTPAITLAYSGTAIPIANGGTGQTTANPAFNALSPMTTVGDLIYGGSSGVATRLPRGSQGQSLFSNGAAAPVWGWNSGDSGASTFDPRWQGVNTGSNTYSSYACSHMRSTTVLTLDPANYFAHTTINIALVMTGWSAFFLNQTGVGSPYIVLPYNSTAYTLATGSITSAAGYTAVFTCECAGGSNHLTVVSNLSPRGFVLTSGDTWCLNFTYASV